MTIDVYLSNLSEDVWSFIQSMSKKEQKHEIDENAFLSDRDILTLDPQQQSVFVAPYQLDPDFLTYYQQLFSNTKAEVWVPARHTGQVCHDLMKDPTLWKKLVKLGTQYTLRLQSYSTSAQFLTLVEALRQTGATVETPESPSRSQSWTVNYFGSKSGVRQVAQKFESPTAQWMANGYISTGIEDTAALAASYYCQHRGVVIKTNKAHAGMGVEIVHPGQLPDSYEAVYAYFKNLFSQNAYWENFPIIVEHYLELDTEMAGGNPNCEFLVTPDGNVRLLYVCGMRVSSKGVFRGIEIHEKSVPPDVFKQLLAFGQKLGETYAQAGYRGYFDVDCVYTKNKELLMTESNIRRTGGTHVYHAALQLAGPQFMKTAYVLSNNTYVLPVTNSWTFAKIKSKLTPILFSAKTGEGVIIAAANILKQNKLSYIIIGKNKTHALATETKMEKLLVD